VRRKIIVDDFALGPQRRALGDAVFELIESARDDMFPYMPTWEFFQHVVIMRQMYEMHERDQEASAGELARLTAIPASTVQRRLQELLDLGAAERRGCGYLLVPAFFNSESMLRRFRLRRAIVSIATEKTEEPSGEDGGSSQAR
jgi:hypothetical protein